MSADSEGRLNLKELAALCGKDSRTIKSRILKLKPFLIGKEKRYDPKEALPLIYEAYEALQRQLLIEQVKHEEEKVKKATKQNAIIEGEYVKIQDIAEVVEKEYVAIRARLLSMPVMAAHDLIGISDPAVIKAKLDEYINNVLKDFSADIRYSNMREDILSEQARADEQSGESSEDPPADSSESSQASSSAQPG